MANSRFTRWLAIIPCAMIAFSASASASEAVARVQSLARDVALQSDGTLLGRLVSAEGRGIDGAVVSLSRGEEIIGRTTTDADGHYHFADMQSGVYHIKAGRTSRDFRVWDSLTSPPGSQSFAALVEQTNAVRAQSPGFDVTTGLAVGAGIGGLVVGIVAYDKASDAEDDAAELRAIINSISP